MPFNRREVLNTAFFAALGSNVVSFAAIPPASSTERRPRIPGDTGQRMAAAEASYFRPYRSKPFQIPDIATWVQVDLGWSQVIDAVRLYPSRGHILAADGFPLRFRLECSEDEEFRKAKTICDWSKADFPDPGDRILEFAARQATARYIRLTATRLRGGKTPELLALLGDFRKTQDYLASIYRFSIAKIEVMSMGVDISVKRPVAVDTAYGNPTDAQQLTRARRPMGEGVVTDNPQNVTSADQWGAVPNRAESPRSGIVLHDDGLFASVLRNNIQYLLSVYSTDDLLRQFRQRAGRTIPTSAHKPDPFWEEALAGSNAGRFLMGAANTLRWMNNDELRDRMNQVVDGIAECRQQNGYIMGYPENTFFFSERGAYTRAWLTHGLIEAGYSGKKEAFDLLRGYYDWYNKAPFLPEALRGCIQGGQGMVANSRLFFTPVGKPTDLQVLQRYFQENYWLDTLAAREVDAVWQYPYDRPHCYLLTNLEAYCDLYRATGDARYLRAVEGGFDLYRANWQNFGGSISIIEVQTDPPKSNFLYEKLGETCGSAFWTLLNQRLHLLNPDEEKYVSEIEKTIYNVIVANQAGAKGIRYHTMLVGRKEAATNINTCCEGQGTRVLGSLPEFIYSVAKDGVYVNLFEPSTISWQQENADFKLTLQTAFPKNPSVEITISTSKTAFTKMRIRTPSWAIHPMQIHVNGKPTAVGLPGTYTKIERSWSNNDKVTFALPIGLRLSRYVGADQIEGRERYVLEYGPLLMAALGAADAEIDLLFTSDPTELIQKLQPKKDNPLHFVLVSLNAEATFVPYYEIDDEGFSCAPIIDTKVGLF